MCRYVAIIAATSLILVAACSGNRVVLEQEPNNSEETAQVISVGDTIDGTLGPSDHDHYLVPLQPGSLVEVTLEVLSGAPSNFEQCFLLSGTGYEVRYCPEEITKKSMRAYETGEALRIRLYRYSATSGDPGTRYRLSVRWAAFLPTKVILPVTSTTIPLGANFTAWTFHGSAGQKVQFGFHDWMALVMIIDATDPHKPLVIYSAQSALGPAGVSRFGSPTLPRPGQYYLIIQDSEGNLTAHGWPLVMDVKITPPPTSAPSPHHEGSLSRVSVASDGTQGDDESEGGPSISADGRYVAFVSLASNLVPGDTNGTGGVFVHDRETGVTTRVSDGWGVDPSISADGRYVAFVSVASNLVPGDTNGRPDVFVHDRETGVTTRVSVASDGTQGDGSFLYEGPSISADGRYVAYSFRDGNLVAWDVNAAEDVFLHDRNTGKTILLSLPSDVGDFSQTWPHESSRSGAPAISGDGRYVAFVSEATNLVAGDTNGVADVFVVRLW